MEGGDCRQSWSLAGKSTFRLGRGEGSDILLPFPWVSRQHAMIQVEANFNHNLIDLGSANGTMLNGRKIYTPTLLHTNDLIKVGKSELLFILENWKPVETDEEEVDEGDETVAFLQKEQVTILVCDIRQFTSLSEEIGAGPVSEFISLWSKNVNAVVRKNGGQVDKFIGDAVLAMWPRGDDFTMVLKALLSALEISMLTRKLGQRVPGIMKDLRMGAALNTGEAVMGNVGVDGQRDFTIVGDVVNVAFRLEEMTSKQGVDLIIGEKTFQHLEKASAYFTRAQYNLKGKAHSFTAHSASFKNLREYLANWKPLLKTP